ncbi:MAG: hypothetical protein OXE54_06860 [Gammaproteobacteria bacterium]|nr:hypothetical protein [Gammaproteobacteria bacterium]
MKEDNSKIVDKYLKLAGTEVGGLFQTIRTAKSDVFAQKRVQDESATALRNSSLIH